MNKEDIKERDPQESAIVYLLRTNDLLGTVGNSPTVAACANDTGSCM